MIPYTTIPFVSAFFLVLVGVLMGQLFWTRFRSEHQRLILRLRRTIRQQRQEMKQGASDLSTWQSRVSSATKTAEEQFQELECLRSQLAALQADHEAVAAQAAQELQARKDLSLCLQDEKQQRNGEVDKLRADLTAATVQTQAERDQAAAWVSQLAQLQADVSASQRACDQLRLQLREQSEFAAACQRSQQQAEDQYEEVVRQSQLLRERIRQVEQANDLLTRELGDAEAQKLSLIEQFGAAEQAVQHLTSQLQTLQAKQDQLTVRCEQRDVAAIQAQQQQHQRQQQLTEAREQLERMNWEMAVKEQQRSALQGENEALGARLIQAVQERHAMAGQLEQAGAELAQTRQLLAVCQADLKAAEKWRGDAETLLRDLARKDDVIADLDGQVVLLQETIVDLEARYVSLDAQRREHDTSQHAIALALQEEQAKRRHWEAVAEKAKLQLEDVRGEVERLALVEDQLVEMDADHRQTKDELKRIRRERDDIQQVEVSTRQIVAALRDELNERLGAIDALRRDKETSASQLEFERRQRQQIEEALGQAESRLAALQSENDGWSQRQAKLVMQTTELTEQVQQWQTQARDFQERSQRAERQVAELASQLDSQQQLSEKLRRRRFVSLESETPGDGRGGFSFRDMRIREQSWREDDDDKLIPHNELGKIFNGPPRRQDDLKKIPGIADRVEEKLHSLGIYAYRQIMDWNPAVIAEISRRLDLGDLIQRQDWVGHARRLYHEIERNAA